VIRHIRAGSGLGDSIYLQSIVRHLQKQGQQVIPRSNYPDVFKPLGVPVANFSKEGNPMVAHYVTRIAKTGTTQFQDMCLVAGIKTRVEMRLDWQAKDAGLLMGVRKPVIAVMLPRLPMDRKDGFGKDLMPNWQILQQLLDQVKFSKVQIGGGDAVYKYSGIDLDLSNKTSITQLLDVASLVDGFAGMCSFMIPLAESLGKPFFCLWSAAGLASRTQYLRHLTPQKVIHNHDLGKYAIDNWKPEKIERIFSEFLLKAGSNQGAAGETDCAGRLRTGSTG
jgi:hypothetical protein